MTFYTSEIRDDVLQDALVCIFTIAIRKAESGELVPEVRRAPSDGDSSGGGSEVRYLRRVAKGEPLPA